MTTGVTVTNEAMQAVDDVKMHRKYDFTEFQLTQDGKVGAAFPMERVDDFGVTHLVSHVKENIGETQCAFYFVQFGNRVALVSWFPSSAPQKDAELYAAAEGVVCEAAYSPSIVRAHSVAELSDNLTKFLELPEFAWRHHHNPTPAR